MEGRDDQDTYDHWLDDDTTVVEVMFYDWYIDEIFSLIGTRKFMTKTRFNNETSTMAFIGQV